jgi:phospholipase/lecithinase/hemolysin
MLQQLYAAGARNMVIIGFPPMGCLPAQRAIFGDAGQKGCVEDQNSISIEYNKQLQATIPQLQAALPGARLFYGDVYSYIHAAFYNPSQYGEQVLP